MSTSETQSRTASLAEVKAALGDRVVDSFEKDDLWLRVRTDAWKSSMRTLRETLGFHYFGFLSAIDWLPSPYGRGEDDPTEPPPVRDTTIRPGLAGGETRLQVFARVSNPVTHASITVKVDVPNDSPQIESIHDVYAGANWHERETHEMFGIDFIGHPDLRNMYLPVDFEGHPLRKDYPLLARMIKPWPGIVDVEPLPGGDQGGDDE
jgi:NADH-quinone oxidoreductase subunit C